MGITGQGSKDNVTFGPSGSDCRYHDRLAQTPHTGIMEDSRTAQRIRVLVASTDTSLRKLICSSLVRNRRFAVVAQATDGDAAVACPIEFDAAILDVSIAGLGVLGVMSGLRALSSHPVIVVVSRSGAIYLRHACLAEGADEYLVVPDDLDSLPERIVQTVHEAVDQTGPQPVQA